MLELGVAGGGCFSNDPSADVLNMVKGENTQVG
jgi:hypothetical protein